MERKILEFEEGWSYVLPKLKKILDVERKPTCNPDQYMDMYGSIYNMCCHNYDNLRQLYDKYREVIEDYAKKTVVPSLRETHDEYLLRELVRRWDNHKAVVKLFSAIFSYIDRYFVGPRSSNPTLREVGLTCFRNLVYHEMKSKAKDVVLALIHKEREGEQIDRELLKNVLDVYVENGMGNMETYEDDFESFMLQDTTSYYSRKALSWIQIDSCPEYLLKSEECLKKERERVTHYLHSSTEPKLVEIVQHELLVVFAKQLLENEHSGCLALLRDGNMDDLSRIYRLYHSIPQGLELVANLFNKGGILFKQAEDSATNQEELVRLQVLMGIVMELRYKYMVYVTKCFQDRILFHKALKEAFEIFCNKRVAGSSSREELLATFCDNLLKKGGSEKLTDEAIESKLENVVNFLVYISDKDLFAEFYRKKQARRLLFDRSNNEDHERNVLTKLKEQFGGEFTSKMEGMVTDMTMAKESQNSFEEYLATNAIANPGIDLTVTVLTTRFWPSYRTCDLNLPYEMAKCVEVFKGFYETKTKQRKLRWIFSLGTCHIIGKFDQKPIELIVSTYQAAVFLLFNNTERLSYNEMLEQLHLSHEDLVKLLHSLSCTKYKILIKEPNSRSISQSDVFVFNSKFTDRTRRIKISQPPMDERKIVVKDVDRDRRYAIDASLMRIMKSRKVLGYQQLVSECVEHHSRIFKPDINMIRKRIEDLISRDYLERESKNRDILKYLA